MPMSRAMVKLDSIPAVRAWKKRLHGTLGLVPTMGALHEGHLALIRRARAENDHVVVSIFVNPRQFGDSGEFAGYPRTIQRDLELLDQEQVEAVFLPGVDEMYPTGMTTEIRLPGVSDRLEGAARPGHFAGVCTVVCKLLNICGPDRAYFGQKDAQQVVVVRKMVEDLNIPVEIVPVETVRDPDGLAISSRNVFLSDVQRAAAARIPKALFAAQRQNKAGERAAEALRQLVRERIADSELLQIEYVSIADAGELNELETVDRPAVLSVAVYCGETRLIDNVLLD